MIAATSTECIVFILSWMPRAPVESHVESHPLQFIQSYFSDYFYILSYFTIFNAILSTYSEKV